MPHAFGDLSHLWLYNTFLVLSWQLALQKLHPWTCLKMMSALVLPLLRLRSENSCTKSGIPKTIPTVSSFSQAGCPCSHRRTAALELLSSTRALSSVMLLLFSLLSSINLLLLFCSCHPPITLQLFFSVLSFMLWTHLVCSIGRLQLVIHPWDAPALSSFPFGGKGDKCSRASLLRATCWSLSTFGIWEKWTLLEHCRYLLLSVQLARHPLEIVLCPIGA